MKITIEMDSINELHEVLTTRETISVCDHKKDPILARELYEAYTITVHGKHIRFKDHVDSSMDENAFLCFDKLDDEMHAFWQDMANLLEEMKK